MLGLAFQAASDQFIMMSMAQVLVIPMTRPIFEPEVANRMYSISAYYLAQVVAGFAVFFLYPMFTTVISYWWLGLENQDWNGMFDWMGVLCVPAFLGALWGFTLGTFFRDNMKALSFNFVFLNIFNMGAGASVNISSGVGWVPWLISYISPIRYGTEMLISRVLQNKPYAKPVMISLGYTLGDEKCLMAAAIISVILFFTGWLNLIRTNQRD